MVRFVNDDFPVARGRSRPNAGLLEHCEALIVNELPGEAPPTSASDRFADDLQDVLEEAGADPRGRERVGQSVETWFSRSTTGRGPLPEPALLVRENARFFLATSFFYVFPPYAEEEFCATQSDRAKRGLPALEAVVAPADVSELGRRLHSDRPKPYIEVTPRETDIATVPKLLWGFMASYGKQTLPALLHDRLCDDAKEKQRTGPSRAAEAYQDRRFADNMFRHALRSSGVDWFRRWNFWAGVTFGRYAGYRKPMLAVALPAAIVASIYLYTGIALLLAWPFAGEVPHVSGWALGWVDNGIYGWMWDGLTPFAVSITPFVLGFFLRYERLWSLIYVAAYVLAPVGVLVAVDLLVILWVRTIPWLIMKGLSVAGFPIDPGPWIPPWNGPIYVR